MEKRPNMHPHKKSYMDMASKLFTFTFTNPYLHACHSVRSVISLHGDHLVVSSLREVPWAMLICHTQEV